MVGLIGEPGQDIKTNLESFMEDKGFRALGMQSGQVGMHHPHLKPYGEVGGVKVLLVGDAAGQVKVSTVGGIVTGFRGAKAVSQAIGEEKPYAETLKSLKRELDIHWWIRNLLDRLDNQGYDHLFGNISPQVARFLGKHDRDNVQGRFWKLPFIQPRFIPFGLNLLLKTQNHTPIPITRDSTQEHK